MPRKPKRPCSYPGCPNLCDGRFCEEHTFDGKYILDGESLIICQSNARTPDLEEEYPSAKVNPLGDWVGGTNVDTGATNRSVPLLALALNPRQMRMKLKYRQKR